MEKCEDKDVVEAEADLKKAVAEVREAEVALAHAEQDLAVAENEIEAAKNHREVEVIVDRRPHRVEAGIYVVSAFKALVGVAADRELDILRDGALHPLDDTAKMTIEGCEVFVSHVRTGGSS